MLPLLKALATLTFIDRKDAAHSDGFPPIRKLRYQLIGGFIVTAIVFFAKQQGVEIPQDAQDMLKNHMTELIIAGTVVMQFIFGYFTQPAKGETVNRSPLAEKPESED